MSGSISDTDRIGQNPGLSAIGLGKLVSPTCKGAELSRFPEHFVDFGGVDFFSKYHLASKLLQRHGPPFNLLKQVSVKRKCGSFRDQRFLKNRRHIMLV